MAEEYSVAWIHPHFNSLICWWTHRLFLFFVVSNAAVNIVFRSVSPYFQFFRVYSYGWKSSCPSSIYWRDCSFFTEWTQCFQESLGCRCEGSICFFCGMIYWIWFTSEDLSIRIHLGWDLDFFSICTSSFGDLTQSHDFRYHLCDS